MHVWNAIERGSEEILKTILVGRTSFKPLTCLMYYRCFYRASFVINCTFLKDKMGIYLYSYLWI